LGYRSHPNSKRLEHLLVMYAPPDTSRGCSLIEVSNLGDALRGASSARDGTGGRGVMCKEQVDKYVCVCHMCKARVSSVVALSSRSMNEWSERACDGDSAHQKIVSKFGSHRIPQAR